MKKTYLTGAGLLAAGVAAGALFSPIGLAGAQTDSTESDSAPSDESTPENDRRDGRRGHRGHHATDVLEALGLDADTVRAGIEDGQSLLEIAEANGITEAELTAAIETEIEEHLAGAVAEGRLTQEEADEKLADAADRITDMINRTPGEGRGFGGHRGPRGSGVLFDSLEELGLTADALQEGREAGQTLAETAEANGVSTDDLVDALVAGATERIEAKVEEGRIDQERADEMLAEIEDRVTDRVNAEPGERDGFGRRGGHDHSADEEPADA